MEKKKKLVLALGSELTMQIEGMEEKFRSILVGIESPVYLMVRMQIPTRFRNQIDKGTIFIVRYVYLGNVYGFKTKTIGTVDKPYKITFLSYPETVESLNIRKAQRVSCFIPATIGINKRQFRGLVMEISRSGTRFRISSSPDLIREVTINDPISISFPLLGFEGIQNFKGIIKSVNSDSEGLYFGIQFEDIKPGVENMIDGYVKDVLDIH
jgi:c-di-GMP-binding flagellar brake protein YcgR